METKPAEVNSAVKQHEAMGDHFEQVLSHSSAGNPPPYPTAMPPAGMAPPAAQGAPYTGYYGQQYVAVPPPQVIVHDAEPVPSNVGAVIFSCIVFWLFCWPLGLAAFCVALSASGNGIQTAYDVRRKLRLSHGLSIAGVISGIICITFIVVYYTTQTPNN